MVCDNLSLSVSASVASVGTLGGRTRPSYLAVRLANCDGGSTLSVKYHLQKRLKYRFIFHFATK